MEEVLIVAFVFDVALMGAIYLAYYRYMLGLVRLRAPSSAVSSAELPYISVILPTFNEENTIEGKLGDLLNQGYPLDRMEVIVMDSGSVDKTISIVESFTSSHPMLDLRLIKEPERRGKSAAVNIATHNVSPKSEITVITDSDSRFGKDSLRRVVESFRDPKVGLVTGLHRVANPDESAATMMESTYSQFSRLLRQGESLVDSTPLSDGFLACRTPVIQNLSVRTDVNADDTQLAILTRRKGLRSILNPDAVFFEFAPPNATEMNRQKVRRGQGIMRTLWGNRDLVFNRAYGKFGSLIFPMNFFMYIISPVMSVIAVALMLGMVGVGLVEGQVWFSVFITAIALFLVIFGGRNKVCNSIMTFFYYQLILFKAILLSVTGKSLHKWQKIDSVRNGERWTGMDDNREERSVTAETS